MYKKEPMRDQVIFYPLLLFIKDFISNWKCFRKEAAS